MRGNGGQRPLFASLSESCAAVPPHLTFDRKTRMRPIHICLSLAFIATPAVAAELKDALIPCAPGLHVYDAGRIDGGAPRLVLAPQFLGDLQSLGEGRIFDLGPYAKTLGVDPKPEELILYSPKSKLVFCRGSRDTIDRVQQLFESHDHDLMAYRFTLYEGNSEPAVNDGSVAVAARRIVMRGSSVSGARFEVSLTESQNFSLEFTVDPSEQRIDVNATGTVQLGDSVIKISTHFVGKEGADLLLFERPARQAKQRFDRLILRIDPMPDEEQLHHNEEWQREQSRKIAKELSELKKSNKQWDATGDNVPR